MGLDFTIDMTWGAWSCLVLVRIDQKINLQTQGVLANSDWASALWLQQHSGILGLPKSPGKVIVSNVSEVDIAVAIFPAKSNVLPVIYCCPLKFHIGQPTTWSSTWVKFQGSSHTVFWDGEDPVLPARVVVHPQSLWHELRQQSIWNVREGVKKKRIYLGLCPKHRTPPPHRARLGQSRKKTFFYNLWGLKASWNGQIWPPHLCITC